MVPNPGELVTFTPYSSPYRYRIRSWTFFSPMLFQLYSSLMPMASPANSFFIWVSCSSSMPTPSSMMLISRFPSVRLVSIKIRPFPPLGLIPWI